MAWKRTEVAHRIRTVADSEWETVALPVNLHGSFRKALCRDSGLAVIAEIKRRSPSAGEISPMCTAPDQALRYAGGQADALSILTDNRFFGGSMQDLTDSVRTLRKHGLSTPCLRKEFMVHPIQVLEAAKAGASAILIIVRALPDHEIRDLHSAAEQAGLDVLYEVHREDEIDRALSAGARIIGVNNRDLSRFTTDLSLSERLLPVIPKECVAVSESGIRSREDAARVRSAGAHAVLVGESLMREKEPEKLLETFRSVR